jgi:hypothetical protein
MVGFAATNGVVVGAREGPEIESLKSKDLLTGGAGLLALPLLLFGWKSHLMQNCLRF